MRQRIGRALSYSNVMATVAVFIALGGGAYAVSLKRNSVGSKQIKANAVKASEAKESTFGTVPNAGKLDGTDSTGFARTGSPPWREVAAQTSSFGDCGAFFTWYNINPAENSTAAFYRDSLGTVHLKGTVRCNVPFVARIFTLPPGYRPDRLENHVTVAGGPTGANSIVIQKDGGVFPASAAGTEAYLSLDGITFRCAPPGSDGCP